MDNLRIKSYNDTRTLNDLEAVHGTEGFVDYGYKM